MKKSRLLLTSVALASVAALHNPSSLALAFDFESGGTSTSTLNVPAADDPSFISHWYVAGAVPVITSPPFPNAHGGLRTLANDRPGDIGVRFDTPIDFDSAYLLGWTGYPAESVVITGYLSGSAVGSVTISLSTAWALHNFGPAFDAVDELYFHPLRGGINEAVFAIDDIGFVRAGASPVPDSGHTLASLFGACALLLYGKRHSRERAVPGKAGKRLFALSACAWIALAGAPAQAQSLSLIEGFEGNTSGWIPADPIIAAGPSSVVTMVSGGIAIFNKQGTKLFEENLGGGGFWWSVGADLVAEPWIIFDPNSDRFIAVAREVGNNLGRIYLAVSKTSTPLGSADWHKYALDRSGTHQGPDFSGVATFPDNPKVGVDGNAIYITSLHFAKDQNITRNFSHAEIFALEKAPLLLGGAPNFVHNEPVITESFSSALAFSIHPAIVFGPASAMYFVQSLTRLPDDKIVIHALSGGMRTSWPVPVAMFDRPPNVPQLGSDILLDNIDARLMSAVMRNGSLWTAHAVKGVDAESLVRWFEFDITGLPSTDATLMQSGDVDPGAGIHTWLPHINVDEQGNMGLCFSVGGASQYAAIGYTGRLATDAPGTTLPVQIARNGEGPYTAGGWGEYSGLAIDPDGKTFWLFHQYPRQSSRKWKGWGAFVGAFQVLPPPPPPADPLHSGDLDGSSATSGKNWKATVAVTIHDANENVVPGATVSVQWTGGFSGTATLTSDSNGRCTFTSGAISKQSASVSLSILNVTHPAITYNASANHDPDLDSNGTTILVNKP